MPKIEIKSRWDVHVLFSGEFADMRRAVEDVVRSRANLSEADLTGADLTKADLTKANLSGAYLTGAGLTKANLSRADLSGANLFGADLSGANLSWANLSWADLSWADLTKANLSGANLTGADLTKANLSGANLSGADLSRAYLSGAKIRNEITVKQPPVQIFGLTWPITIWDCHMQIGCEFHSHGDWREFSDEKWVEMGGKDALRLKREHLGTLMALCDTHSKEALNL